MICGDERMCETIHQKYPDLTKRKSYTGFISPWLFNLVDLPYFDRRNLAGYPGGNPFARATFLVGGKVQGIPLKYTTTIIKKIQSKILKHVL